MNFDEMLALAIRIALGFSVWVGTSTGFAASCCGGGSSSSATITNDDLALLGVSYSRTQGFAEVDQKGVWHRKESDDYRSTIRFDVAHVFWDRWQFGASLPVVEKQKTNSPLQQGVGDLMVSTGYEYLTDWNYSKWQPRGFVFLSLLLPTGTSIYDLKQTTPDDLLRVTGQGQTELSLSSQLSKAWALWDVYATASMQISKEPKHKGAVDLSLRSRRESGLQGSVGLGYNLANWRLGTFLLGARDNALLLGGAGASDAAPKNVYTVGIVAGYSLSDSWSGSVTYSDNSRIGSPRNTDLEQALNLQIQHHWLR